MCVILVRIATQVLQKVKDMLDIRNDDSLQEQPCRLS